MAEMNTCLNCTKLYLELVEKEELTPEQFLAALSEVFDKYTSWLVPHGGGPLTTVERRMLEQFFLWMHHECPDETGVSQSAK
jgi:hypothetical protein